MKLVCDKIGIPQENPNKIQNKTWKARRIDKETATSKSPKERKTHKDTSENITWKDKLKDIGRRRETQKKLG